MRTHFIQHVSFESPGYLLQWAHLQGHTVSFTRMYEKADFPGVGEIDWLVVMGGPMGVYDEDKYEWLKPEKEFIRAVIGAKKKVLGICLGSQLVAGALDAKVYPHTEKEIGWWPVQKVSNGTATTFAAVLPDAFTPFHWHGDTFDIPPHAIHLLKTDICPHQAFVYDNRVMGLQFHMEVTPELVAAMATHGREELNTASRRVQSEQEILNETRYYSRNNEYLSNLLTAFIHTKQLELK